MSAIGDIDQQEHTLHFYNLKCEDSRIVVPLLLSHCYKAAPHQIMPECILVEASLQGILGLIVTCRKLLSG